MDRLSYEQELALYEALTTAGILHGDLTNITLSLGVVATEKGCPHFPFCSATVRRGDVRRHGHKSLHAQPIRGAVIFRNADLLTECLHGMTGIVVLGGKVHTNGRVDLHLQPKPLLFSPLREEESVGQLFSHHGRELTQKALLLAA